MAAGALIDADLVVRKLSIKNADVVFVKGIFEASEGLCAMFAERGGELTIVAPHTRARELDAVLKELVLELGGILEPAGAELYFPQS
jgi:hypothetical protein